MQHLSWTQEASAAKAFMQRETKTKGANRQRDGGVTYVHGGVSEVHEQHQGGCQDSPAPLQTAPLVQVDVHMQASLSLLPGPLAPGLLGEAHLLGKDGHNLGPALCIQSVPRRVWAHSAMKLVSEQHRHDRGLPLGEDGDPSAALCPQPVREALWGHSQR